MAGFHHAEDDPVVLAPDCSDFIPPVTAEEVENETDLDKKRELLRQYVKGVIKITNKIFVDAGEDVFCRYGGGSTPDRTTTNKKTTSRSWCKVLPKSTLF